jgi:hypothetical protein
MCAQEWLAEVYNVLFVLVPHISRTHTPMRIFCVACVLAVLHLSCTAASFFSIVTETPPYLRRPGPVPLVLEWDTGDIARQMALSQGVFVSHQVPAR